MEKKDKNIEEEQLENISDNDKDNDKLDEIEETENNIEEVNDDKEETIDDLERQNTMKIDSLEEVADSNNNNDKDNDNDNDNDNISNEESDDNSSNNLKNSRNIAWIIVSLLSILLIIVVTILVLNITNEKKDNTSNDGSNNPDINDQNNNQSNNSNDEDNENKTIKYSFKDNPKGGQNIVVNDVEYDFKANSYSNIKQFDDIVLFVTNHISSKSFYGITKDNEVINFSCKDHEKIMNDVKVDRFYNTTMCDNFKINYDNDSVTIKSENTGQDVLGLKQCPTGNTIADVTEKFVYLGNGKFSAPVTEKKTLCKDRPEYNKIAEDSIKEKLNYNIKNVPNSAVGEKILVVGGKEYNFNAISYTDFKVINDALFFNTNSPSGSTAKGITADGKTINFSCKENAKYNKNYDINIDTKNCNFINLSYEGNSIKVKSVLYGNGGLVESTCKSKDDVIETVEKIEYLGNGTFSKPMVVKNVTCKEHRDYDRIFGNSSKLDYKFKTILPKGNDLGGDNIIVGGKEFAFMADRYDQLGVINDILFFRVDTKDISEYYAVDDKGQLYHFGNYKPTLPSINIKTKLDNHIKISVTNNVLTITTNKFGNGGFIPSNCKPDDIVEVTEEISYLGYGKFSDSKVIKEIKCKDYPTRNN